MQIDTDFCNVYDYVTSEYCTDQEDFYITKICVNNKKINILDLINKIKINKFFGINDINTDASETLISYAQNIICSDVPEYYRDEYENIIFRLIHNISCVNNARVLFKIFDMALNQSYISICIMIINKNVRIPIHTIYAVYNYFKLYNLQTKARDIYNLLIYTINYYIKKLVFDDKFQEYLEISLFNELAYLLILNNEEYLFSLVKPYFDFSYHKEKKPCSICRYVYKDYIKDLSSNLCLSMYNLCKFCFLKIYKISKKDADRNLYHIISSSYTEIFHFIMYHTHKSKFNDYEIIRHCINFNIIYVYFNNKYIDQLQDFIGANAQNISPPVSVIRFKANFAKFINMNMIRNPDYGDRLLKVSNAKIHDNNMLIGLYLDLLVLVPENYIKHIKPYNNNIIYDHLQVIMANIKSLNVHQQYEILFEVSNKNKYSEKLFTLLLCYDIKPDIDIMKTVLKGAYFYDNFEKLKILIEITYNLYDIKLSKKTLQKLLNIGLDPNIIIAYNYKNIDVEISVKNNLRDLLDQKINIIQIVKAQNHINPVNSILTSYISF